MSPLQPVADMAAPSPPPAIHVGGMSRQHIAPINEPIVESPKARNWGWGWGAVSGALKEVSAGVAKDVQELKASFQAAIQVDSDEEDEEEEDMAAREESGKKTATNSEDTSAYLDPGLIFFLVGGGGGGCLLLPHMFARGVISILSHSCAASPSAPPEPTAEQLKRQEVLARLEGEDTEIEKGLKVSAAFACRVLGERKSGGLPLASTGRQQPGKGVQGNGRGQNEGRSGREIQRVSARGNG